MGKPTQRYEGEKPTGGKAWGNIVKRANIIGIIQTFSMKYIDAFYSQVLMTSKE